ncbi:PD-(D/E)XK motif protein [Pseudomonas sp. JAI120]|uniref:PD-(D/E)XK motif protein n=1 Tax=Pseudomonas sp. JAI120 TaxID=2723063 RepID=UPI0030D8755D
MPRVIEEFVTAWEALSGERGEEGGWLGIPVVTVGECELMAARRFPGNEEALLARFPTVRIGSSVRLPEGKGFEVVLADPRGDGKTWIALSRKESGSTELFSEMVGDVVGAMEACAGEGEGAIQQTMLRRVRMWQQFMSHGAAFLSPEEELGLMGELAFMDTLIRAGVSSEEVLRGWVGPEDALQDFQLGSGAIEVKATLSSSGFPVKITSLEQLDDSVSSPLFLAAVRFRCGGGGMTLPEMIAKTMYRLRGESGAVSIFRDSLMVAGYSETQSRYYNRRFELEETRVFVVSESFPRLTTGTVPVGVTRALYEINLDHATEFLSDLETALKLLGING